VGARVAVRGRQYISLFSGGMGLDLGLERAGFRALMYADNDPAAVATIRQNRADTPVYDADIASLDATKIREMLKFKKLDLDLLAGGPPCQSFSTAGKRLSLDDAKKGPLLFEFVRLLDELRPKAFLLENVKGILSASSCWRSLPYNNNGKIIDVHHGSLLRELTKRIRSCGYSLHYRELNAADFGVPQVRKRVFFVGFRDGTTPTLPEPSHSRDADMFGVPWRPIRDFLSELKHDDSHCAKFSPRKLKYLKLVPPGGNWRDLPVRLQKESMGAAYFAKGGRTGYWRRLSFDEPAPTILTEPQNASTSLCHPVEHRPLSVRECARIQTFPDDWVFVGRGSAQYRLVGNAVPVLLAERVGEAIAQSLSEACPIRGAA